MSTVRKIQQTVPHRQQLLHRSMRWWDSFSSSVISLWFLQVSRCSWTSLNNYNKKKTDDGDRTWRSKQPSCLRSWTGSFVLVRWILSVHYLLIHGSFKQEYIICVFNSCLKRSSCFITTLARLCVNLQTWIVLLPAWSCSPYQVFQVPTSSQGYSGSAWMEGKTSSLKDLQRTHTNVEKREISAAFIITATQITDFLPKFIVSIEALRLDIVNCKETKNMFK